MNGRCGGRKNPSRVHRRSAEVFIGTSLELNLNNMDRDDYNEQREAYQRERGEEYFTREPKDNRYEDD